MPQATGLTAWSLYGALLAAVLGSAFASQWKRWFAASFGLFVILILEDQHRFQPWAYQYGMTLLFLAMPPTGEGLKYARWWFVALYLHSGLSKLDASFCRELGPVFLSIAVKPLGFDPGRWNESLRTVAVLSMPVLEIVEALALLLPATRVIGRFGAIVLHLTLIAILGPTGLGHSLNVLIWNAAIMVEVWVAFGPDLPSDAGSIGRAWPVKWAFWVGVLMPFGERWGVWDAWPSHALYASHVERLSVQVHESALGHYPASLRANSRRIGEGPWMRVDLNGWSRFARGTPIYPGNRAALGLAEALEASYGGPFPVRIVAAGAADRWTGRRRTVEVRGLEEIRALAASYWFNTRPWPGKERSGETLR